MAWITDGLKLKLHHMTYEEGMAILLMAHFFPVIYFSYTWVWFELG